MSNCLYNDDNNIQKLTLVLGKDLEDYYKGVPNALSPSQSMDKYKFSIRQLFNVTGNNYSSDVDLNSAIKRYVSCITNKYTPISQPSKQKSYWWVIGITSFIVVIILGVLFVYTRKPNRGRRDSNTDLELYKDINKMLERKNKENATEIIRNKDLNNKISEKDKALEKKNKQNAIEINLISKKAIEANKDLKKQNYEKNKAFRRLNTERAIETNLIRKNAYGINNKLQDENKKLDAESAFLYKNLNEVKELNKEKVEKNNELEKKIIDLEDKLSFEKKLTDMYYKDAGIMYDMNNKLRGIKPPKDRRGSF